MNGRVVFKINLSLEFEKISVRQEVVRYRTSDDIVISVCIPHIDPTYRIDEIEKRSDIVAAKVYLKGCCFGKC